MAYAVTWVCDFHKLLIVNDLVLVDVSAKIVSSGGAPLDVEF